MKTFIENETLLLMDNDIYLISNDIIKTGDLYFNLTPFCVTKWEGLSANIGTVKIVASTKQLPNVKQLPREVFVKGVDVEELARIEAKTINYPAVATGFYSGFIYGYNANKNEFTKGQLTEAIKLAYRYGQGNVKPLLQTIGAILNEFEPKLQLPKSITTNDELEIISVTW